MADQAKLTATKVRATKERKMQEQTNSTEHNNLTAAQPTYNSATAPVYAAQPTERISAEDKAALDLALANKDKLLLAAKLAISQSETAEMNYNNFVLRLAIRYSLKDGDSVDNLTGEIKRK